ncbi:MAG: hypothetical protein ABI862_13400 [Ilumatobacteraceae bacterium]
MGSMLNRKLRAGGEAPNEVSRDCGSALVMAAIVSVVVFALAAILLSFADHQSSASNSDRQRQQAIDAASSGLVVADSALTKNGSPPDSGLVTLPGGSAAYDVKVRDPHVLGAPYRRVLTSVGSSSNSVRTMQQEVELAPVGFTYGVFSERDLVAGPKWVVKGDLYTNGNLTFGKSASSEYFGDIYARGFIETGKAAVTGSLFANGYVNVNGVTGIGGINAGGKVNGSCTASGSIKPCLLVPPVAEQHLPSFTWNAANYPMGFTSLTGPTSNVGTKGVVYVAGNVVFGKHDDLVLTGNLTIVAKGNITLPRGVSKAAGVSASVQLTVISTCSPAIPCANGAIGTIDTGNNFSYTVPVLMYTKGLFDAKNSSDFFGVLYAGSIDAHANISVTYAAVTTPGFDWSLANPQNFTIRHISTKEINSSS